MTRDQFLFLARVVVDGSRRRDGYSEEFVQTITSLIELARESKAKDAVILLDAELVRRKEMHRNVVKMEPNAVKRFLASA